MSWWNLLSKMAHTILLMSATGGIVALLLFALKPVIKNNLPKSIQYYLWVLVLFAFLVPFSSFLSLPFASPMANLQEIINEKVKTTQERREEISQERYHTAYKSLTAPAQIDISYHDLGLANGTFNDYLLSLLLTFGWMRFLYNIVSYFFYTTRLRQKRLDAKSSEMAMLHALCKTRKCPRLYRSHLAKTPMLVGLFRPVIYLPDREFSDDQLLNILLHECSHLRRYDVMIKWIAAVAVHVHWFNPIAYFVRRELNRACELACDEAVINNLDNEGRQRYGNTLIAIASAAASRRILVSTTMCEEKKTLKERLNAIMINKKRSKKVIVFSGVLLLIVICIIVVLGAAANQKSKLNSKTGLAPYALSENESNILAYFKLNNNSQIISYHAPADAISLKVNVYRLDHDRWEQINDGGISVGTDQQPKQQLEGIFAMTLKDNYAIDFNIIGNGTGSYTTDAISLNSDIVSSAIGFLTDFQEIELNKEIPVAIMIYDDGTAMKSYTLQDYFNPSTFAGMDLVQVVTLTFTNDEL